MITGVSAHNYKCYEDIEVDCRNLNLLAGINGMGKSTIIQILLLFLQSYEKNELALHSPLLINGNYVTIGSIQELMYWYRQTDYFNIKVSNDEGCVAFQMGEIDTIPCVTENSIDNCSSLFSGFEYVSAERIGPRRYYDSASSDGSFRNTVGVKGESAVAVLQKLGADTHVYEEVKHPKEESSRLDLQVNAWMSEISPNIRIAVDAFNSVSVMGLRFETSNATGSESASPVNMGFGMSYTLPVIVALLKAREGDVLVLENPEAHLHPRAQRRMGELVSMVAARGVQIFMETHSDHILNGIRLSVRNKVISSNDVAINYFYQTEENGIYTHRKSSPQILNNGSMTDWPEGFFDEWELAIDELLDM